jgi:hypothetical protein
MAAPSSSMPFGNALHRRCPGCGRRWPECAVSRAAPGYSKPGGRRIHDGTAVLRSAAMRRRSEQPLDRLQEWALEIQERQGHNKAAVAVANKLARRLWAMDHHGCRYAPNHISPVPQHQQR